jgi:hypothetical protein
MARAPNYGHERREREKNKAAKRAARAEAKKAKSEDRQTDENGEPVGETAGGAVPDPTATPDQKSEKES